MQKLKALHDELGRKPTRDEFRKRFDCTERKISLAFGTFTDFLRACGIDPVTKTKQKSHALFERDLARILDDHKPRGFAPSLIKTTSLIIPDTHFPFVSQRTLEWIYRMIQKYKPGHVIQIGDLFDLYSHTRFPRSHNLYSPHQEEELGRRGAEEMWKIIRGLVPDAKLVQMKGNHDLRPLKQTLSLLPQLEHVVDDHVNKLMTFDGVTLISDPRQEYIFEGVAYLHGHFSGIGKHRDFMLMSTAHGHTHTGGVVFRPIYDPITQEIRIIFELDAGFAGDRESKVFGYTPQKLGKETPGCGLIDVDGARFLPAAS